MWSILLLSVVAQSAPVEPGSEAPATVSVVSSGRDAALNESVSAQIEAAARRALEAQGLGVQSADRTKALLEPRKAASCDTNRACYALLGLAVGTPWIVRVEGSMVESDVAVFAQALSSRDGTVAAEHSFVTHVGALDDALTKELGAFAQKVKTATAAANPFASAATAPGSDAPRRPDLTVGTNAGANRGAELGAVTSATPRSRTPAYMTLGGAVVAAGAAATFTAMGASANACLNGPEVNGRPTVCVPQSEAPALARQANANFTAGAISGAVAIALGAASAYLLLED